MINISGLGLGLAVSVLVTLYVELELRFDRFHENFSRLYRVEVNYDNKGRCLAFSHPPLGPALLAEYPDILGYTRFLTINDPALLTVGESRQYETNGLYADSHFLQLFSFSLLQGDPATALSEPNSILLSRELARKYFGSQDPLGRVLRFEDAIDCKVTGIVEDCPVESHIRYNFILTYETYRTFGGADYLENWSRIANYTYVLLREGTRLQDFNIKIRSMLRPHLPPGVEMPVYLKPLDGLHFSPRVIGEPGPGGDPEMIRFLILLGAAVLILACINFINLATAQSTRRALEVAVRKAVGADRRALFFQFLTEAMLIAFAALGLGLLIARAGLQIFGHLVGRTLEWSLPAFVGAFPWIVLTTFMVGLLSGSYPAFHLSSFQPARMFRGAAGSGKPGLVRKALVVFQFAISILLIIATWIMYRQIHYMQHRDPGYDGGRILVTQFRRMDAATVGRYETMREEVRRIPGVVHASISRFVPSFNGSSSSFRGWEGSSATDQLVMNLNLIDDQFLDTYGMALVSGRSFKEVSPKDTNGYCLLNETAAARLGWEDAVGKRLGPQLQVLGVVRDFHFASMRYAIEPLVLFPLPAGSQGGRAHNQLSIKLSAEHTAETVAAIRRTYEKIFPQDLFVYSYFEDSYNWIYRSERSTAQTAAWLSGIAIFISLLGLIGLASFTAAQRTKEIGIRKILGSSAAGILWLLTKEYTRWVALASIMAWPTGFLLMKRWLESFAFRQDPAPLIFLLTGLLALLAALATVAYQTLRAALSDPVRALRYE